MSKQASGEQPNRAAIASLRDLTVDQFGRPLDDPDAIRAGYIAAGHPTNDGEAAGGGDGGNGNGDGAQAADHGNGESPFAAVLEAATNDRDAVAAALKSTEASVTQRFQEAAEFRRQWEPFASLGLGEIGPDGVGEAMGLRQLFADPSKAADMVADKDRFIATWEQIGEALGYFDEEPNGQAAGTAPTGDEAPPWAAGLISRLDAIEQRDQTREAEAVQSQADQQVRDQLDALKTEHGEFDETRVLQLSQGYALAGHQDAIAKGFADLQTILGGAEQGLVTRKANAPAPANDGGQPVVTAEAPKDFKEARDIAARRLAAATT